MKKRDLSALKSPEISALERRGIALAKEASLEGAVLLQNDGVLPLAPQKVALFGYGARHTIISGIGSGDIVQRYFVNVEEGLENNGFSVVSKAWLDEFDGIYSAYRHKLLSDGAKESEETGEDLMHVIYKKPHILPMSQPITEADLSDDCDTAVYIFSRQEGEGIDNHYIKGEYLPFDEELLQLKTLRDHFKNLIIVLNTGAPVEMAEILKLSPNAVMQAFQGGAEIGNAIAELLCGKENPSGKVTCTWAKDYWDFPNSKEFGANDDKTDYELYKEGVYMGYRYFDSFQKESLYPFGYGLSYTTFALEAQKLDRKGSRIQLQVKVTNTGNFAGKEVVQLYLSSPNKKLDGPYQQLCAYEKTKKLAPGESEVLTLSFAMEDMAGFFPEASAYLLEAGDYALRVGNASNCTFIGGIVRLSDEKVTRKVRHLFERPILFEELKAPSLEVSALEHAERQSVSVCYLTPDDIPSDGEISYTDHHVNYFGGKIDPEKVNTGAGEQVFLDVPEMISLADVKKGRYTMDELIASMDADELIHLTVGQYHIDPRFKLKHVSTHVPGAAGESTNFFVRERPEREIPYAVTADGPAGLRLIPHIQAYENGEIVFVDPLLAYAGGEYAMGDSGYVDDAEDYYQYVTALPISIQLASTWNTDLLYKIGSLIGEEMEKYDVDLWLAPGLNLHRNPLCGRNYEYFSEDPFVSAAVSIALTKGVQAHPGKGVTIKHFAVNNQEAARTSHCSVVTERTARDLYLKAFELIVKYADPRALMTSLNCVNGPHGANSKDLGTYVLRDEWGFNGFVMTDWNTTTPARGGSTTGCINSGDDLIMPGSEDDIVKLHAALTNLSATGDKVTLGALQSCARHVLEFLIRTDRV